MITYYRASTSVDELVFTFESVDELGARRAPAQQVEHECGEESGVHLSANWSQKKTHDDLQLTVELRAVEVHLAAAPRFQTLIVEQKVLVDA